MEKLYRWHLLYHQLADIFCAPQILPRSSHSDRNIFPLFFLVQLLFLPGRLLLLLDAVAVRDGCIRRMAERCTAHSPPQVYIDLYIYMRLYLSVRVCCPSHIFRHVDVFIPPLIVIPSHNAGLPAPAMCHPQLLGDLTLFVGTFPSGHSRGLCGTV